MPGSLDSVLLGAEMSVVSSIVGQCREVQNSILQFSVVQYGAGQCSKVHKCSAQ